MQISPQSGSRSSPLCRATYKIIEQSSGKTKYPDEGWPKAAIENSVPYQTAKVRLRDAACLEGKAYLRFAMRADDPIHLDVIPYDPSNKPVGWFSFYRLEQFVCAGRAVEIVDSLRRLPQEVKVLLGHGRSGIDGLVDSDSKLNVSDPNLPMRRFKWAALNADCVFSIIERGGSHDPFEVDDFRRAPEYWISSGRWFSRTAPTIDEVMRGVK